MPLPTPSFTGDLLPAVLRAGRDDLDERVLLRVVGDGRFRHDERVGVLLEHDLGVRGHVRLELFARVVDRDAHLEVGDVVLLDAHRRDLRDLAVEHLVLERFDADARRLTEPHAADVGLVHLAAHEHLIDVAERHDQRGVRAEVQDRRHRAADLDVARQHGAADRRADRRVCDVFGGAVGGRLGLRHLRARFGHLRLADRQLRLRGALAVLRHVHQAVCIVERRLRDQVLREQRLRALVGAARELLVRPFRLDDVLLQLRLGAFERRARGQQVGLGAAQRGGELLAIELDEDVAGLHRAIDVGVQDLDDAVRLRLDFDLGDRLDLAGGDDRLDHRAALDRREPRRVDVGRRALQRRETGRAAEDDQGHRGADVQAFP